jgi:hypothetical protein
MNEGYPPFYGKYRGIVSDNQDPLMQGRIRAKLQDVLGGNESGWALPSVPYAGRGVGLFLIPPVNTSVWIEFEHGDPDYPIWAGCFWAPGEVPAIPALPDMKVLKTALGTITLNDLQGAGGITIETTIGTGAKIVMNVQGIEITSGAGSIKLSATGVSVNNGALEVM